MIALILGPTFLLFTTASSPGWFGAVGGYGSITRGNQEFMDIGSKGKLSYQWHNQNQLKFDNENYFWDSYGYSALTTKGSGRFDYNLVPDKLSLFVLSSAKRDEGRKLDLELEESLGLSYQFLPAAFLEARSGYRNSLKSSDPREQAWIASYGLYIYRNIQSYLTLSIENAYLHTLYNDQTSRWFTARDGWVWNKIRLEVPAQKYLHLYVEVENNFYVQSWPGVKRDDLYTRFGLDFWL